jgi:hypothetical protein
MYKFKTNKFMKNKNESQNLLVVVIVIITTGLEYIYRKKMKRKYFLLNKSL